jgi:hypothetical protein
MPKPVWVWLVAIAALPASASGQELAEAMRLSSEGSRLTEAQAVALEQKVKHDPEDLPARTQLLGYYGRQYRSEPARRAREGHALWLIEHHPEAGAAGVVEAQLDPILSAAGYKRGRALWLEHAAAKPKDTRVLDNAARFLLVWDPAEAERLLKAGQALEPNEPRWATELGHLKSLELSRLKGEKRTAAARAALGYYEHATRGVDADGRRSLLPNLAKLSFEAGDPAAAQKYALEMLAEAEHDQSWNHGNLLHVAHLVLGRLALKQGDVEQAKKELLESASTAGSPQLDSFGPSMRLAEELLERDERETVLQYFAACARFWKIGGARLDKWTATVKAGGRPDFGSNLGY